MTSSAKNIALFGGSFNPPHLAHPHLAFAVLQTQPVDEIVVLPTDTHPTKSNLAALSHRMEMCRRGFETLADVRVSGIESKLPHPNYTVQTLEYVHKRWTFEELFYIIGTDLAEEVPDWKHADGLDDLCTILLAPRQGYPVIDPPEELGDYQKIELGFDLPELSSTFVRRLLNRDVDCSKFLDQDVLQYIQDHELYGVS